MDTNSPVLHDTSPRPRLCRDDMKAFAQDAKIALLATVSPEGLPHITLITSLQAKTHDSLMFGQFTEGSSKAHMRENPRVGFLVMSPQREIWRGTAFWKRAVKSGEDFDLYNHKPMFRYNAYFGIHTVHYLDLVELHGKERLSVPALVGGALRTAVSRKLATPRAAQAGTRPALTPWARKHISKLATLKFVAYVAADGHPRILPPIAGTAADSGRLVLAAGAHRSELAGLAAGAKVAVLAINTQAESVLMRGSLIGRGVNAGLQAAAIDIDFVYNSMPPKQGVIYPPEPLGPVTDFGGDSA